MTQHRRAVRHLQAVDPVLSAVIGRVGPCRLQRVLAPFPALVRAIIHQQLALKAARTIEGRVLALFTGDQQGPDGFPRPLALRRMHANKLRAAGLSRPKIAYMRDLADRTQDGTQELDRMDFMDDEALIAHLTQVKGIGRWTAEMLLIFSLGRPDVLPVDDLGIRLAFQSTYGTRQLPSVARLRRTARAWQPHRTVASWYLWQVRRIDMDYEVVP
jgi:3-methyladenine DNA glycosylase/8-oxoguanine DNA glycosylase